MEEAQLDCVGCFKYSPVEGTTANELPDHISDEFIELCPVGQSYMDAAEVDGNVNLLNCNKMVWSRGYPEV